MDINNNQTASTQAQADDASAKPVDDVLFEDGLSYGDIVRKDILELMGFTTLSEERKQALYDKIERGIDNRVAARIFDALTEEERAQYQKLTDESKFEEAGQLLQSKGIDAKKWVLEETIIMKMELYEDSRYLKKKVAESAKKQTGTADSDNK